MAQRAVTIHPQRPDVPADRGCAGNDPAIERTLQSVTPMLDRVFRLIPEEPFTEEIAGFVERLHAGPLGKRGTRTRQVA